MRTLTETFVDGDSNVQHLVPEYFVDDGNINETVNRYFERYDENNDGVVDRAEAKLLLSELIS